MLRRSVATLLLAISCMASAAHAADKPLTVGMTTWVGYGLLHLADKKGFFKSHDVDVSLMTVQDKPSTAAAIATGRLDGWATTVDTAMFYNAQKLGIKQVLAVDFSKGGEGIVAANDIRSVSDLKGRKLGAEEGSSTYFLLLNLLADNGMKTFLPRLDAAWREFMVRPTPIGLMPIGASATQNLWTGGQIRGWQRQIWNHSVMTLL